MMYIALKSSRDVMVAAVNLPEVPGVGHVINVVLCKKPGPAPAEFWEACFQVQEVQWKAQNLFKAFSWMDMWKKEECAPAEVSLTVVGLNEATRNYMAEVSRDRTQEIPLNPTLQGLM